MQQRRTTLRGHRGRPAVVLLNAAAAGGLAVTLPAFADTRPTSPAALTIAVGVTALQSTTELIAQFLGA